MTAKSNRYRMIVEVTLEVIHDIIETRKPIGLFYSKYGEYFVGVDNSTGDAWTEDFTSLEACKSLFRISPNMIY